MNHLRSLYEWHDKSPEKLISSPGFWQPALQDIAKKLDQTLAFRAIQSTSNLEYSSGRYGPGVTGTVYFRLSFKASSQQNLKSIKNEPIKVVFSYDAGKLDMELTRKYKKYRKNVPCIEDEDAVGRAIAQFLVEVVSTKI